MLFRSVSNPPHSNFYPMRFDSSPHCSCSISYNWISQATSLEDDHCSAFLHWLQTKAGTRISSVLAVATSSFGRSGLPLNKLPIYLFFYYLSVRTSPCSLYGVFAVCFPVILICLSTNQFLEALVSESDLLFSGR